MRKHSNLAKSEGGQVLILVVIVLMLAMLIIPPLLNLTFSSHRSTTIRQEGMQQLYAADMGVEDALHAIHYLGNGTNPKVPGEIDDPPTNYTLGEDVNGHTVDVSVRKEGNGTYIITSTGSSDDTGVHTTVEVHVTMGNATTQEYSPVTPPTPPPWDPSGNPFSYAMASIGEGEPLDIANNGIIDGDIFVNGDLSASGGNTLITGTAWANGTMLLTGGATVEGNAHAVGSMTLEQSAVVEGNAYVDGYLELLNSGRIGGGAQAKGYIEMRNLSQIGDSAWADGDIDVLGESRIWGNASSNQDIIVDGGTIYGNAYAVGSITEINGGAVLNEKTEGGAAFVLTLPQMPKITPLTDEQIDQMAADYKDEADGPEDGGYTHVGDLSIGKKDNPHDLGPVYITGSLSITNGAEVTVHGTVYVDGNIEILNNCEVQGAATIVAEGNIDIKNNEFASLTEIPLIMSVYGDINISNNGYFAAAVYAPNGTISLDKSVVQGTVVGQSVETKNLFEAIYDESVMDVPGLPGSEYYPDPPDPPPPPPTPPPEPEPRTDWFGVRIDSYIIIE